MKHLLSIAMLVALSLVFISAPAYASDKSIGFVRNVSGEAHILRNGETISATEGAQLQEGDTLSTGPNSSMGISFRDDSSASLGPDSSFVVSSFEFSPRNGKTGFLMRITKGSFVYLSGLIAKMSPESALFVTPTATIGLRGTRFAVNIEDIDAP
jgi:hypothetical protein